MMVAANFSLYGSHSPLSWCVIGLIGGTLAGRVVYGGGFGCLANVAVGLAGAIIGGFLLTYIGPEKGFSGTVLDDMVVAFLGALVLLGIVRLVRPPHGGRRSPWR